LALRLTVGGLLAGHGAQKLFGSFGGYGLEGTAGWLESIGLKPGKPWAYLAGGGEFGSGVLTALCVMGPVGPISIWGPMLMAWNKAHAGKPIWVASGGAELPLINMAAGAALAFTGPGRFSVDGALGIKTSRALAAATVVGVAAGVIAGITTPQPAPEPEKAEAYENLEGGEAGGASESGEAVSS
jgi:putative oxidoreductase